MQEVSQKWTGKVIHWKESWENQNKQNSNIEETDSRISNFNFNFFFFFLDECGQLKPAVEIFNGGIVSGWFGGGDGENSELNWFCRFEGLMKNNTFNHLQMAIQALTQIQQV